MSYDEIAEKKGESSERIVPHIEEKLNYLMHLKRYEFSLPYVTGKKVLDIGCGTGYGSFLLSDTAKEVTGIDISGKAINFAQDHYKKKNLKFLRMDWKDIGELNEKFDAVVSFEFLEHIEESDKLLEMIKSITVNPCIVIMSTPNKSVSSGTNVFHLKEFTPHEFESLLSKHFNEFQIYGEFVRDAAKNIHEKIMDIDYELMRCIRYTEMLRKMLAPARCIRNIFIPRKNISQRRKNGMSEGLLGKLDNALISKEDILLSSSRDNLWKSDYLLVVIYKEH